MIPVLQPVPQARSFWPWRSASLAAVVFVVALVLGLPPFLRMPPWCDLTLYDVAAQNLLAGGVHYRDVFDTNLPGFVWILALLRALFGWSGEALRLADLAFVATGVLTLDRLAVWGGASRAARVWVFAAIALFYLFTPEFVHAQRDVWMLAPAAAATALRVRRLTSNRTVIRGAFLEGCLWAIGIWIKPHVLIPAVAVWLATAPWALARGSWGELLADFCGTLAGGLAIGGAGGVWLLATGTGPAFHEAFTFWNAGYARLMWAEFPGRLEMQLHYFPPWSYLQLASLPLALVLIGDTRGGLSRFGSSWIWYAAPDDRARLARLALAVLTLAWMGQALVLQRQFLYVHVPDVFLALALLATQRWSAGCLMISWVLVTTSLVLVTRTPPQSDVPEFRDPARWWAIQHASTDPERVRLWSECWHGNRTVDEDRRLTTSLGRMQGFHAANDWAELGEVADWLRDRNATAADVIAWHDAPHAVYLMLDGRPAFRFQHVSQMLGIGAEQEYRIRMELAQVRPRVRFVVSDLLREGSDDPNRLPDWREVGFDGLPPGLRLDVRAGFPYTIPVVYRSGQGRGRYLIHDLSALR